LTLTDSSWALADAVFSGKGKRGGEKLWPEKKGYSYNKIMSPTELMAKSNKRYHNEILLIGKPNIRTYPGIPATTRLKVKEIVYVSKEKGNGVSNFDTAKYTYVEQLKKVNPGVRVTII